MANVFKLTSTNCIEWTVNYSNKQYYISEKFILQEIKCNLSLLLNSYSGVSLFCESCVQMKTAVDIRVLANSSNFKRIYQKCKFTGTRQEIWSSMNNGFGHTGSLTFEVIFFCDIFKDGETEDSCGRPEFGEYKPSSYLQKNVHFQAISRDFSKLLHDSSSCDVVIKCEDKTFKAHKIVLQARSTVFAAMLKSNMVEANTGTITVKEIKSSIFECFLKYLYSGMLPKLTRENVKEFYSIGDQYHVNEFTKACSEFMIKNITEGNACDLLAVADLHNDADFRKKAIEYIIEKKIPKRDQKWSEFCNMHSDLAIEIMNLYIKKHCPH